MATTTPDEEIIEKRPSHPVSTACLILSAAAMLGAIAFQVVEIGEVRAKVSPSVLGSPNPSKKFMEGQLKEFDTAVAAVITANDHPDIGRKSGGAAAEKEAEPAAAEEEEAPPPAGKKAPLPPRPGLRPEKSAKAAPEPAEPPAEAEEKPSEPAAEPAAEAAPEDGKADEAKKADEKTPADKKADKKADAPAGDAGAGEGGGTTEESPAGGDEKGQ